MLKATWDQETKAWKLDSQSDQSKHTRRLSPERPAGGGDEGKPDQVPVISGATSGVQLSSANCGSNVEGKLVS